MYTTFQEIRKESSEWINRSLKVEENVKCWRWGGWKGAWGGKKGLDDDDDDDQLVEIIHVFRWNMRVEAAVSVDNNATL